MDTDESIENDSSSEIERSPFRYLRRYLRGVRKTDRHKTVDLHDVSLPHYQTHDSYSGRTPPSAEREEHSAKVRRPNEAEQTNPTTFGSRPRPTSVCQIMHRNYSRCSSSHSRRSGNFRVPYTFVFAPFPGHTCLGRGIVLLGTIVVKIDGNSQLARLFKFDATFQSMLNNYNCQDPALVKDPVELRHVTKVDMQSLIEIRASEGVASNLRNRRVLVITLLKSYPGCQVCKVRGRVDDWLPF